MEIDDLQETYLSGSLATDELEPFHIYPNGESITFITPLVWDIGNEASIVFYGIRQLFLSQNDQPTVLKITLNGLRQGVLPDSSNTTIRHLLKYLRDKKLINYDKVESYINENEKW